MNYLTLTYWMIAFSICQSSCHSPTSTTVNHTENQALESGFASIGPLNMYYEIHGSGGIPLVLIHGGGSTIGTTFGNIIGLLSKNRKIIAVEMQGHGHTKDIDRPETFEQDADDIAGLLKFLKIEKADILGFSNGGNTAMQVDIRHPDVVRKLVVISAMYKREGMLDGFFDMMQHASLDNMPQPLQDAFLKIDPDRNHLLAMHDKDRNRMIQFQDWSDEDLKSIQAPTLLIVGDKDVVKPEHTVMMSKLIPVSELMIVPGTHGSFIGEICSVKEGSNMPSLVVETIEEFLDTSR